MRVASISEFKFEFKFEFEFVYAPERSGWRLRTRDQTRDGGGKDEGAAYGR